MSVEFALSIAFTSLKSKSATVNLDSEELVICVNAQKNVFLMKSLVCV